MAKRGRKPKRACVSCGVSWKGLYDKCLSCRKSQCDHANTHFDSALSTVCACGSVLKKQRQSFGRIGTPRFQRIVAMLREDVPTDDISKETGISEKQIIKIKNGQYREQKHAFIGSNVGEPAQ